MLIDQEKKTLQAIADIEIQKVKTQLAAAELQTQTQMTLMKDEERIFKERLANERKFLEAKIALQPKGLATEEQAKQRQALIDQEKSFNDKQLNTQTELNNDIERKRFESAEAIKGIQKDLNDGLEGLGNKQNENTQKAADKTIEIEEQKEALRRDLINKSMELIQTISSTIGDILTADVERQLEQSQERIDNNNETIAQLEASREGATQRQQERIDQEIERQKEQNEAELKQREKLEKEREAIEKRQFLIDKAFAIGEATINTSVAYTQALAQPPGPPFTIPNAILAAVLGGIQIAAIAAQAITQFSKGGLIKYAQGGTIPEATKQASFNLLDNISFAVGGVLEGQPRKGGIFKGKSHAQGGIMINNNTAEVEGDEIIMTKGVYRNPIKRAIASALNVSEGGVAFAKGGIMNHSMIPKLQAGGVNFDNIAVDSTQVTRETARIIAQEFQNIPAPRVSVDEINSVQTRVDVIENDASF